MQVLHGHGERPARTYLADFNDIATFERDHEMTMAKNARESLNLIEAALARIDDGSYGVCESCGQAIGKMRLQAFPRATLCMECKQRQDRR